jgi:hypothetical protein
MSNTPRVNSKGVHELDKVQEQFDDFQAQTKAITVDVASKAPMEDFVPQTLISNKEANNSIRYIKPSKSIGSKEPFNEKYRAAYEEAKKFVRCIVENREMQGEKVESWTKPFPGMPAEFWEVPVNVPIAVPRYVAQRLSECKYHRLTMEDRATGTTGSATWTGAMVVSETTHRIDCRGVGSNFVAMGS